MRVIVKLPSATVRKLHLYVAGETPATFRARAQCGALCEAAPGLRIEEVDVIRTPDLAEAAAVLATPTLTNNAVTPPRRIVGDFGEARRVLQFLGIEGF